MKHYLLSFIGTALILFSAISCSEKKNPDPSVGSLVTELNFSPDGGKQSVAIFSENLDSWKAYATESWISITPSVEDGFLYVEVSPTDRIEDHSGKIVVYSDMDKTLEISVNQKGNGILYDRPSRTLMGLRGEVKSVDSYFNPMYMWETQPTYLYNVEFDIKGMIIHFEYKLVVAGTGEINYAADLKYDLDYRLSEIKATTDSYYEELPSEFTIKFSYGDHGKYISTQNLFEPIESWGCYIWERMWMPEMIKDLTGIKLTSEIIERYIGEKSVEIKIEANEEGAEALYLMGEEQYALNSYKFNGAFTSEMTFDISFVGVVIPCYVYYELDQNSGYITKMQQRNDEVYGILREKRYNTDRYNSCYSYVDNYRTYYRMSLEYNDRSEIISLTNDSQRAHAEFSYEYDEKGNWVKITMAEGSTPASKPFDSERNIVYYQPTEF